MFRLTKDRKAELDALIEQAVKDPYLGDVVIHSKGHFEPIYDGDVMAGFFKPRRDSDGRYRAGAIYVAKVYRSKGLAKKALGEYFKGKPGRAYIEDENQASIKLFTSIGFKATDRTLTDSDKVVLRQYLKD